MTFDAAAREPEAIRDALRARGINVSVTTTTSTRLDMDARGLRAMVRASVHYYNTEDEIERFCRDLRAML